MKDKLFLWSVFISNKKMKIVHENTKSKTFWYVNGHALASPKGNLFFKILNLLVFNT